MKYLPLLLALLCAGIPLRAQDNARHVDPFIGTQGTGHTFPGASMPFGMVQPSPDNRDTDWNYTSGYQYADTTLLGFSQTHLSGTGIGDMGDVLLLPFASEQGKHRMDKTQETARPGYYALRKGDGVYCEMTASQRVALHRYTYPQNQGKLLVDLQHGLRFLTDSLVIDSKVNFRGRREISGHCYTNNWVKRKYFFCIRFDQPFKSKRELPRGPKEQAPRYELDFRLKGPLHVKVALSSTSEEDARRNMDELPGWDLDARAQQTYQAWNRYLDRIEIQAPDSTKTLFYTSMYHLLLQPSDMADVDGRYRGADDRIGRLPSGQYYSTLSNWDVYRAAFPLLAIVAPERIDPIVSSMLAHQQATGILPIWALWGQDNYCMIGNHAISMIATAYSYGFRGFDAQQALRAMVQTSEQDHIHSAWSVLERYGYYPFDIVKDEAISKALENGYDDWCLSHFATALGEQQVARKFGQRAQLYRNTFCPDYKLFRGRDSQGKWRTPFDPVRATSPMNNPGDYTEANAWQYFWTPAQYDVQGVAQLLGGTDSLEAQLDRFFTLPVPNPDKHLGQEAMIGQYAHGNEPGHHIAYLYNHTRSPHKTDRYVQQIVRQFHRTGPSGMIGNDDCGQMSAWYILSCLGFYPVNPATDTFELGAPQLEQAVLHLPGGRTTTIRAHRSDPEAYHTLQARCDGKPLDGRNITYQTLMKGINLDFDLGHGPDTLRQERYTPLPFGSVKPQGWLRKQMQRDLDGLLGQLDKLVPELMQDPIYSSGRLTRHSKAKDLGNLKEGDAGGDEQYKWWNSETQSNWRDAYVRHALLLDDSAALARTRDYILQMLGTQDADGYLGIYTPELRYQFETENGELWAKTTLYRALLAYYEATGDTQVWQALQRAVDEVMRRWPAGASHPFAAGQEYNGGTAHGLTFTDVLDRMSQLTGQRRYRDYALFLYRDYSEHFSSESDAQLGNILRKDYRLCCHGVHTYEHLRPLTVAAFASEDDTLQLALDRYLQRLREVTTPTGGAIGDEWIAGRKAHPTHTGYEYCSLHELMDSYGTLLQKRGDRFAPEAMENIFYNAAQGARHPHHPVIAYLKTDNSFEMLGSRNGEAEPDRQQTRYKYSAVHQDVAVCCVPNAMRISPYFVQKAWMLDAEGALVAQLLLPNTLSTKLNGQEVRIETITEYPKAHDFRLRIQAPGPLTLKVRKPEWAQQVHSAQPYRLQDGYLVFEGLKSGEISFSFDASVRVLQQADGLHYFAYGAQVYALPIQAKEIAGRSYGPGYRDYTYSPLSAARYRYLPDHQARYRNGRLRVRLYHEQQGKTEWVELLPIGKTVLRQAAF